MSGELSESYEGVVLDHSQHNFFGVFSVKSQDIRYTQHCHNCKYLFGCVGLRNAKYCIFNKQYTKEEYEELLPKIIAHMNEMPFVDKQGLSYKYGEFFPIELSPFGYNETIAMDESPLRREQALTKGYNWQDNIQRTSGKETLAQEEIPDSILDIDDSMLEQILACSSCSRNYKIVNNELIFYRRMNIPVPRQCFYCRHAGRLSWRNPMKICQRNCMCENIQHHNHLGDVCSAEFETTISPNRSEIIYCETCYQSER